MVTNVVTLEDLQKFKDELVEEMKQVLSERQGISFNRWLKSHQVRRILTISPGTLQHLRLNGTLPFTKVGGVIYYDANDIEQMLLKGKQNATLADSKILLQKV